MTTIFEAVADIDATPALIWAVLCDVERWPEWTSTMTSVRRLDHGPFGVGSKAKIVQPKLRDAIWEVTELDANKSFTWISRNPGVYVTGRHCVDSVGECSRVSLSLEFTGLLAPIVARVYRDLNRRYLATEAQGLKRRCET
jgi:uncharacterized membrane protein